MDKISDKLMILKLRNSTNFQICDIDAAHQHIIVVDIKSSRVGQILRHCFVSVSSLQTLHLVESNISLLFEKSFRNLSKLIFVDLSNNPLATFEENVFEHCPTLKALHVMFNFSTTAISLSGIRTLTVDVIFTTTHQLCCLTENQTLCSLQVSSNESREYSCDNLLPRHQTPISISFICVVALCSILSVTLHIKKITHFKLSFVLTTSVLHFTDAFVVLYLLLLVIAEFNYGEDFVVYELFWMSSEMCFTIHCTVTLHLILYQSFLALAAVCRCMIVIKPILTSYKKSKFVMKNILVLFLVAAVFSIAMTLSVRLTVRKLAFRMCLPVSDAEQNSITVEVTTWLVFAMQTVVWFLTTISHVSIELKLNQKKETSILAKSVETTYKSLHVQLVLVTLVFSVFVFATNSIFVTVMKLPGFAPGLLWAVVSIIPGHSVLHAVVSVSFCVRKCFQSRTPNQKVLEPS